MNYVLTNIHVMYVLVILLSFIIVGPLREIIIMRSYVIVSAYSELISTDKRNCTCQIYFSWHISNVV